MIKQCGGKAGGGWQSICVYPAWFHDGGGDHHRYSHRRLSRTHAIHNGYAEKTLRHTHAPSKTPENFNFDLTTVILSYLHARNRLKVLYKRLNRQKAHLSEKLICFPLEMRDIA